MSANRGGDMARTVILPTLAHSPSNCWWYFLANLMNSHLPTSSPNLSRFWLTRGLILTSIMHDWKHRKMPSEWKDEDDFCTWLEAKKLDKGIELIVSHVAHSDSPTWQAWRILKCLHEWMGGWQAQHNPGSSTAVEQDRKIPSKKTGCWCCLMLKFYWHTETILRNYKSEHDHLLGEANLRFTQLTDKTRELVTEMIHMGINTKLIVSNDLLCAYLKN